MLDFVAACMENCEASTPLVAMHQAYETFCVESNRPALGWVAFGMELFRHGYRTNVNFEADDPRMLALAERHWQGVRLWGAS